MLFKCSFPSSFSARAENIKRIGVIIHEVAQRVERSCQLSYFEDEDKECFSIFCRLATVQMREMTTEVDLLGRCLSLDHAQ